MSKYIDAYDKLNDIRARVREEVARTNGGMKMTKKKEVVLEAQAKALAIEVRRLKRDLKAAEQARVRSAPSAFVTRCKRLGAELFKSCIKFLLEPGTWKFKT